MMRILLMLKLLIVSSFAFSTQEVENYVRNKLHSEVTLHKVEIKEQQKISKNVESVLYSLDVSYENERFQREYYLFVIDGHYFSDEIYDKSGVPQGQKLKKEAVSKKLLKSVQAGDYITLNEGKKPIYVFTDPECPYCKRAILHVEKKMKEGSVRLIFIPVHGESAVEKSAYVYENFDKIEGIDAKITFLKKVFNGEINKKPKDKKYIQKVEALQKKFFDAGLEGVPFIVE